MIAPHTSTKELATLVEDLLGLRRYQLFRPNVAISEQQETQSHVNMAQEQLMAEDQTQPLV